MARVNVYLPDDLADRLRAARRAGPRLNVSAVLREALEARLGRPPSPEPPR